jgi:cytochrome b
MKNAIQVSIRVWDLPTRLGHWLLALLVIAAVLSGEEKGLLYAIHVGSGIGAATIVLFRLVWGVVGNERARFADFVRGWTAARSYAGALMRLRPPRFLGHNPLGGWMIVALLAVVLLTAATGMTAGGLLGPALARPAEEVHEALGSLLQILIAVHVVGVLVDWFLTGDNLIAAMIGGRKRAEAAIVDESGASTGARDARGGAVWLALLVAAPLVLFGGWLYGVLDPASAPATTADGERD